MSILYPSRKEDIMANIVISGVYASTSALPTGASAPANGTTYLVGSKIPYDLYTYQTSGTKYVKGDKVSNVVGDLTTPVTVDDITVNPAVSKLYGISFVGPNGETLKVRKGLHLGEIHLYKPAAS